MHPATLSSLDVWYSGLFDIGVNELWTRTTARHHTKFKDSPGYYVVWRGAGAHVSLPEASDSPTARWLSSQAVEVVASVAFWQDFAQTRGLQVFGPSIHSYLDSDPGPVNAVRTIGMPALGALQALVDTRDWAESGWQDTPAHTFGLYDDSGSLIAASNLNNFQGLPRDVGVLVAPGWRGRGLSEVVGRHAASHAIRNYGFARWGARKANSASIAAARRLGFEGWCTQLWVR